MTERKTFSRNVIEETLNIIAEKLDIDTVVYLIGGGAMIFYGRKIATKDIDIVFTNSSSLMRFQEAAKKAGFKPVSDPGEEYDKIGAWVILEADSGIRLDLFHRQVCDALELTETIKARSRHFSDLNNLHVYLMSPEDVVLFKGITERESDLDDIRILVEAGINWDIVEEECLSQKDSGRWALLLLDKLDDLSAKYGMRPRVTRIKEHSESYLLKETFKMILNEKELSFKEIHTAIKKGAGYSESWTRTMIKKLEEDGLITSRKVGRKNIYNLVRPSAQ